MTRVGLVEAGNLKRSSGTEIDHARAFASMAGSLDMIIPCRIFRCASDTFRHPDESGFNIAVDPLKVRGFLPAEEAQEPVHHSALGALVLQLRAEGQGHRRRQEEDFREARRRGPDRAAVAQALRQAQALHQAQARPDQCQVGCR
jgi:hypothetical protein